MYKRKIIGTSDTTLYTTLPVNVPKRKMYDFWFIRKRKFSNSSVINEFYFEEGSKKGRFYWEYLQVKWYYYCTWCNFWYLRAQNRRKTGTKNGTRFFSENPDTIFIEFKE